MQPVFLYHLGPETLSLLRSSGACPQVHIQQATPCPLQREAQSPPQTCQGRLVWLSLPGRVSGFASSFTGLELQGVEDCGAKQTQTSRSRLL